MTPIRAKSEDQSSPVSAPGGTARRSQLNDVGGTAGDSEVGGHSVFHAPSTAAVFPAATSFDNGAVEGIVGAAVSTPGQQAASSAPDPSPSGSPDDGSPTTRVRTNDLIMELQEISGQVNRMMAQVDRAIERLGVHAGEPLRR